MVGAREVSLANSVIPEPTIVCTVTSEGLAARGQSTGGELFGSEADLHEGDTYSADSGSCFAGDVATGVNYSSRDFIVVGFGLILGIIISIVFALIRRSMKK